MKKNNTLLIEIYKSLNNSSPPIMQDFYKLKFAPNNPQKPKYPQIPPKNYLLAISKYGTQVLYLLWNIYYGIWFQFNIKTILKNSKGKEIFGNLQPVPENYAIRNYEKKL